MRSSNTGNALSRRLVKIIFEPTAQPESLHTQGSDKAQMPMPSIWPESPARVSAATLPGLNDEFLCYHITISAPSAPKLWAIRESLSPVHMLDLALNSELLSQEEKRAISNIRSPVAASRKAVARILLRAALSHVSDNRTKPLDWCIEYDTHGRPSVAAQGATLVPGFSISHTQGLIVCAVFLPTKAKLAARIGVDVELCARKVKLAPLLRKALTHNERQRLQSEQAHCRDQSFLRLWTLKEAWCKAIGLGLQADMARAEFGYQNDSIQMTSRHTGSEARTRHGQGCWSFAQFKLFNTHWVAVATQHPIT